MTDKQPAREVIEGSVVEKAPQGTSTNTASAIVLRADQDEFDHKQLSTLALISPGLSAAPRGHLAMFFHYCVRTGLDPFARQIYMIGRKNWKHAENPEEEPEKTWTIQTGIDGFRAVAHRAAAKAGEAISYEDTVYYDSEGRAHEVWLSKAYPTAVKVTVLRGAARFPFIAKWEEFAPTFYSSKQGAYVVAKMWQQMPAHMLRKCAEAGGLRMAAPQDLSGVYVDEEMEQADAEATASIAEDATRRLRQAAGLEDESEKETKPAPNVPEGEPEQEPAPAKRTKPRKTTATSESTAQEPEEESPPARKRATPRKRAAALKSRAS
ncbi:recombinase RecT [Streptomyces sp. NBC_01187]|uniref:recombinase RecT n=1 Tax=Streptomyces sp. NBC_01187 TaxID=2903766 RepID=UPI003867A685|nr:recombinase RecT [Streptomyces sp. NBC_01187]